MLLQFVVQNFLSFRAPGTLSLLAAEGVEHAAGQVMPGPEGRDVLRCAAIYGANASGKSNLVRALQFALDLILYGRQSGRRIGIRPFKLDLVLPQDVSRFELEIGAGARRYSYGFEVTDMRVQAEWLLVSEGDDEEVLLEREAPERNDAPERITIGEALTANPERRQFLRFVAEGTRRNQLFLTEAHEHNVTELDPLFAALRSISIIWPASSYGTLAQSLDADAAFRSFLGEFLKGAGTGVEDIEVERLEWDAAQLPRGLLDGWPTDKESFSDELGAIRRVDGDRLETLTLRGVHRALDDRRVRFWLDEESDGTRRLLHLGPALYLLNRAEREHAFAIDELERSLHPLLTRLFLQRFLASGSPDIPSQLIFTTHDTNLLDLSLLSRDSIWFTEKDPHGASALYSLAEFKAEQLDQLGPSLEQGYLQGRFGAIPFLGDPERLRWIKRGARQP